MAYSPKAYLVFLRIVVMLEAQLQSFFRRILSDIVQIGHITVPSSSRLPGSGDVLTAGS
jgi:hypothetical protein